MRASRRSIRQLPKVKSFRSKAAVDRRPASIVVHQPGLLHGSLTTFVYSYSIGGILGTRIRQRDEARKRRRHGVRVGLHSERRARLIPIRALLPVFPICSATQRMPIPHTTSRDTPTTGFTFSSRINNVCRSLATASLYSLSLPSPLRVYTCASRACLSTFEGETGGKGKDERKKEREEKKGKDPAFLLSFRRQCHFQRFLIRFGSRRAFVSTRD